MGKRSLLNLLLLAAAAALGAAVWHLTRPVPSGAQRLSQLDPARVQSIRIERAGAAPVQLGKSGEAWTVEGTPPLRADPIKVSRVLEVLSAESRTRYPGTDLKRYELDPPGAALTLNDERFDFGVINPVSGLQYVAAGGEVHLVPAGIGAWLPWNRNDVISRQPLGPGEQPVAIATPQFRVGRDGAAWGIEPAAERPSQDDLLRYVDAWRQAIAASSTPAPGDPAAAERIVIELADGRRIEFRVLAREPALRLWRADEGVAYEFSGTEARRLMSRPDADG